jgi:hypothetical protein
LPAISPFAPGLTKYFGPPSRVTIAGTPDAIASSTTLPNVSVDDGNTKASMDA